jgi:hypothetical protein
MSLWRHLPQPLHDWQPATRARHFDFRHFTPGPVVALYSVMTRQFHHPVRLIKRSRRAPRPHTLSFTPFHLVEITDREPGEQAYVAIEVQDPTNASRSLAMKPRSF